MKTTISEFEKWVKDNYVGQIMNEAPFDWDREKEFFYLIDGKQYRIQMVDVPKRFRIEAL